MRITAVVASIAAMFLAIGLPGYAKNLWYDNFNDNKIDPRYITENNPWSAGNGAKWVEEDGVLKQTEPVPGDPTYCVIEIPNAPEAIGAMAKIRFDDWQDHDRSRAGLGVWLDPNDNWNGYTFVIHNRLQNGDVQFLNDRRAWDNNVKAQFTVEVGEWFWMMIFIDPKKSRIYGKIWHDGEPEPEKWTLEDDYTTFGDVRQPTPFVGLNGGSGTTAEGGHSTASFDEFIVFDEGGPEPTPVSVMGKMATTWGMIKGY
ncbi:hypothetical protein DRP77_00405 [Candidatus Poribacteria bacterium]|nr:MAG: hypothetical protein DRP77_00405 [Candidatus Poribacteria bacterium]